MTVLGTLFLLPGVPCPALIRRLLCCLIVSCFVLSSYLRLLETYSSLKRKKKGSCAGITERWRGARSWGKGNWLGSTLWEKSLFSIFKKVKKKRTVFYILYSIGTHHNFRQSLPLSDLIGTKHTLRRLCLYIFVDF